MHLKPTRDRVLLRINERAQTSPGGILLPEDVRGTEVFDTAEVLALGPQARTDLAPGQVVAFKKAAVHRFEYEGQHLAVATPDALLMQVDGARVSRLV